MRKFFFLLTILFTGLVAQAQVEVKPTVPVTGADAAAAPPTKAVMTFTDGNYDTDCDYGTVDYNGEPLRVVKFKNTGTEPLIIKMLVVAAAVQFQTGQRAYPSR